MEARQPRADLGAPGGSVQLGHASASGDGVHRPATAIPFMDRDAADYKEYLDQKNFEEGPPLLASRVMCHYQDMLWQGAFCCSGSTVLTRERVVSKLMLDMVHLVEAIHFDRDGSMHSRNVDGSHDGSMTPDVQEH